MVLRCSAGKRHEPNHLFDRADCGDHAHFVLLWLALAELEIVAHK
jgi:hypothetical protein